MAAGWPSNRIISSFPTTTFYPLYFSSLVPARIWQQSLQQVKPYSKFTIHLIDPLEEHEGLWTLTTFMYYRSHKSCPLITLKRTFSPRKEKMGTAEWIISLNNPSNNSSAKSLYQSISDDDLISRPTLKITK